MGDWKYFHHTNKHYRLMTATRNWDDARNDCKHGGGDLTSVTSLYEEEFIESLVITTRAWLGGSSSDGSTWYWSDGSSFDSYDGWNSGQGGAAGKTDVGPNGRWNHADASLLKPYVCEV